MGKPRLEHSVPDRSRPERARSEALPALGRAVFVPDFSRRRWPQSKAFISVALCDGAEAYHAGSAGTYPRFRTPKSGQTGRLAVRL